MFKTKKQILSTSPVDLSDDEIDDFIMRLPRCKKPDGKRWCCRCGRKIHCDKRESKKCCIHSSD